MKALPTHLIFSSLQQQMSSYPDLVAYHSIAVTLGQAGHIRELFDVGDTVQSLPKKKFRTGIHKGWDLRLEPDIVVYNAVSNNQTTITNPVGEIVGSNNCTCYFMTHLHDR